MLMNPADASMSISISYLSFLQVNWFVLKVEYSGSKLEISVQILFVIGLVEHVYSSVIFGQNSIHFVRQYEVILLEHYKESSIGTFLESMEE